MDFATYYKGNMLLLGHRGYKPNGLTIGNTMEAFDAAVKYGLDGIETDVRISQDGQLILLHDRLVSNNIPVNSLSRKSLEVMLGHDIPILSDAINCWPNIYWDIEIKDVDALPAVFRLLHGNNNLASVLLTSFRHDVINFVAEHTKIQCGLLMAHRPSSLETLLQPWKHLSTMRTLVWDYDFIDQIMIEEANALSYKCGIYGAISEQEHSLCRNLSVWAMITDYPEALKCAK